MTPLFELPLFDSAWWPVPDRQQLLVGCDWGEENRPLTLVVNWTEALKQP